MLPLSDHRWASLKAGYGVLHQVPSLLMRLERGEDVWEALWEELHHQGDVGEASYAAVPHLVRIAASAARRDWNLYALVSVIEVERHRKSNPRMPDWLRADYRGALQRVFELGLSDLAITSDEMSLRAILGALALAKAISWLRRCKSRSWLNKVVSAMGIDEATFKGRYEERWARVAEMFDRTWWTLRHDMKWILIEPVELGTQN